MLDFILNNGVNIVIEACKRHLTAFKHFLKVNKYVQLFVGKKAGLKVREVVGW